MLTPMNALDRSATRLAFVRRHLPNPDFRIAPASADASFRSYWRVETADSTPILSSFVLMDAPPDKEPIAKLDKIGVESAVSTRQ